MGLAFRLSTLASRRRSPQSRSVWQAAGQTVLKITSRWRRIRITAWPSIPSPVKSNGARAAVTSCRRSTRPRSVPSANRSRGSARHTRPDADFDRPLPISFPKSPSRYPVPVRDYAHGVPCSTDRSVRSCSRSFPAKAWSPGVGRERVPAHDQQQRQVNVPEDLKG